MCVRAVSQVKIFLLLLILMASGTQFAFAQKDILETEFNFRLRDQSVQQALDEITRETGFYFIYDVDLVKPDQKIGKIKGPLTLRQYLDKCLNNAELDYKLINRHIVISKRSLVISKPIVQFPNDSAEYFVLKGQIVDAENHQPIAFASASINYTSLGAVANSEGKFVLKVNKILQNHELRISHIGFKVITIPMVSLNPEQCVFLLQRDIVSLQEVVIRNQDPMKLLANAVKHITTNYVTQPVVLTGYYREAASRNARYYTISEAIIQTYKPSFYSLIETEQVKVLKSRKTQNPNATDTTIISLKAGLKACMMLDITRNLPDFLKSDNATLYHFEMTDILKFESEPAYVVAFVQRETTAEPLLCGKIYIDKKSYAILATEFEINPKYIYKIKDEMVVRNKKRVNVNPQRIFYRVSYRLWEGKYYINHVRGDMDFKIRKHNQLFFNNYHLFFETATNDIDTLNVKRFKHKETNDLNSVFSVSTPNQDPDFWGNSIIIEPETPFEKALILINQKISEAKR